MNAMMRCRWIPAVAAASVLGFSGVANAAEAPSYPTPEQYTQPEVYVREATRWLGSHSDHPGGPRVALDLYMVGRVAGSEALVEKMKEFLLLKYAGSFPAAYVVTTYAKPDEYREFLSTQADRRFGDMSPGLAQQFCRATALGRRHFGAGFLKDAAFALKAMLAAEVVGDGEMRALALGQVRAETGPGNDLARAADLVISPDMDLAERVAALHGIRGNPTVTLVERALISRLPPAALETPRMRAIRAENHLAEGELAEALPLIEKLGETAEQPKWQFRKAWCLAAGGDKAASQQVISALRETSPDSEWAEAAARLEPAVRALPRNRLRVLHALGDVLQSLRDGLDVLEVMLLIEREGREPVHVYVGLVSGESAEVQVRSAGRILAAYRTGADRCALYSAEDGVIRRFSSAGPCVKPQFGIEKREDGTFRFRAGMELGGDLESVSRAARGVIGSPCLATPDGVRDLLDYLIEGGKVPERVDKVDGGTRYVWIKPDAYEPRFSETTYTLDPKHRLRSVATEKLTLTGIRYGAKEEVTLQPPAWPDAPTESRDEVDFGAFLAMMKSMMSLVASTE